MRSKLKLHLIDPKAMQLVGALQSKGYLAYLVGGCVRDILVDEEPKDFDIATSAKPEEVKRLIPHSFLIGRRFKLVLVRRGTQQYEISTFRRNKGPEDETVDAESENVSGDNFYGNQEEDAKRRDFTINSLFFDPINNELLDYCEGIPDLSHRVVRFIGEPTQRIIEDPIRILRGIRLAHKLSFSLDIDFRKAITSHGESLNNAILPRKREEYLKILKLKNPDLAFIEMFDLGILQYLLPSLQELFLLPNSMELFSYYLHLSKEALYFKTEPVDHLALMIFSYIKSHPEFSLLEAQQLEENPKLNHFIKDELGVFKQESIYFFKVLEFMSSLTKIDTFKRKGERRKNAFLSHPHLKLANEFCRIENLITYSDYFKWKELLIKSI
ncbi:MAG: hypothetical protein L6Q33_12285 [Bacteriovoracaceae bacterium]|nr:hypothetical protein [Bacteriovoracaceae bacterium]NUM58890.1 poly(A) polymerase [Pseudobdellovibrionaceae bacterium]